jgi:hypothetical protein
MNELEIKGREAEAQFVMPLVNRAGAAIEAGIKTEEQYKAAGAIFQEIKQARKRIEAILDPFVESAHKTWKSAIAERKKYDLPLDQAEAGIAPLIAGYREEQERARRAEQARIDAEARQREEDARIEEAAALEAAGDAEQAAAVISAPILAVTAIQPKAAAPAPGVSFRESYSASVIDLGALIAAVASGAVQQAALTANMSFLHAQARACKAEMKIPGVRVIREVTPISRQG